MTIANLQILERICSTAGSDLYRGRRTNDGMPVLLKLLRSETADAAQFARLRREYHLLQSLDAAGIAKPLALVDDGGSLVLILEDFQGDSLESVLARMRLDFAACLLIARQLAGVLAGIDAAQFVHRNVHPANILVSPDTGQILLVDLSNAAAHEAFSVSPEDGVVSAADWAYVSPEQTGRLNRPIDYRSDFYSLGVMLYRMLTGQLPFQAQDALEWSHCHIARVPPAPCDIAPAVPRTVSDIVMKLLAKLPEDRYQSMHGLRFDLDHCLAQWQAEACVEAFALGSEDLSERFQIPHKLYGRDEEETMLLTTFEDVAATGRSALATVSGYSGIGKSSLVDALRKPIVGRRGYFVSGKFDQYQRDVPYATIVQAFRELVQQLLAESETRIADWREQVKAAVGANGQLIVDVLPLVKVLIGNQAPVPNLPPTEAKIRFRTVLRQFICVFAKAQHPLVLFLDDLQWIDAASLAFIEHLMTQPEVRNLLLIGAYRDNEVSTGHPLIRTLEAIRHADATVTEIRLAPLQIVHLNQLMADTLRAEPVVCEPLTRLLHERTKGNPLFFSQFLNALNKEGLLVHDAKHNRWHGDLDQIKAKDLADNVVDLMVEKLRQLPVSTQEALQVAACLGNRFDLHHLALVSQESESQAGERLAAATREHLISCSRFDGKFLHDRIQQAAYSLIAEASRAEVHLRIGRLLLASMTTDQLAEHLFEVASQFNRGSALLVDEEKAQVATVNLRAGRKAKASAAYTSACTYLSAGMALLEEKNWGDRYELMFGLWLERAECEFLSGHFDMAEQLIGQLLQHGRSKVNLAAAFILKIQLHVVKSENPLAIDCGLRCLRLFGIDIPAHPSWEQVQDEYETLWRNLEGRTIESLIELPLMSDPERQASVRVLSAIFDAAYFTDLNLFCLHMFRMVNISMNHGISDASAQAYGWVGQILGSIFHRYRDGYCFSRLACDLVEKHGYLTFKANVWYAMGNVAFWTQPIGKGIDFHRAAFRTATEMGNLSTACYSMIQASTDLLLRNDPLDVVWRESEIALDFVRKAGFGDVVDIIVSQQRFIATMQGRTASLSTFNDAQFSEAAFEAQLTEDRMPMMICWYWILKLKARFLSGDYAEALVASSKARALLWAQAGRIETIDYFLYAALTVTALYENASAEKQRAWRDLLTEHEAQLREWADTNPPTFRDKHALVSGEIARIEGRAPEAMRLYEVAIQSARENGFVQNEGMAHELAGRFCLARGLTVAGCAYLEQARRCYVRWSAAGKVRQLDEQAPPQLRVQATSASTISPGNVAQLDLLAVTKASQAISGQIVLEDLGSTLMRLMLENAGAQRGYLLLVRDERLVIAVEASVEQQAIRVQWRMDQAESESVLPVSIVNYVRRCQEPVLLTDAMQSNPFSTDDYFARRQPKSVFCLPIMRQSVMIGLLYVENNLATHAFTPERLAVLELLAAQAAISLENAMLYAALRERESRIRRLFDANIIGIFFGDLSGNATEANDAFLQIVGYTRQDLLSGNISWVDMTPPQYREADLRHVETLRRTGSCQPYEKEYIRKDGRRVPVLVGSALMEGSRQNGLAFVLDLTERKRAETAAAENERRYREMQMELAHANRVATMGQLTASIAHEIRQPIAAAVTNAEAALLWLRARPPDPEEVRQALDRIVRDARRASDVIGRIRALIKKAPSRKDRLEINDTVREVIELTRGEAAKNCVSVLTHFAEGLPLISGDRIQLQQVILNLIINAIEAMSGTGERARELVISTEPATSAGVVVAVRDSGPGLALANLDQLFEAFYTTKPGGMGMGLSICRSIVEALGGRLWASANLPHGAIFQFAVPGGHTENAPLRAAGEQSPP
ncbi:ATP-binding sensor histidine kinase [Paraburkholderia sp. BL25I1N1]|uniref:trifunctional serine/threonine-protein kinase/ATP-binding protein/sensor histidine kinase n=1 Tax=Paraburkholderia sp. BL25I1N1 TaxID=1938804 RepID=UPI000D4C395E|nr:ATP-binding sensor histidine kinase [Paraburkholderia sp. BL25I1N1]PRX97550.1 PAS domain S-box-containing protein [Paraburkholderia sp. BL25I1N1]